MGSRLFSSIAFCFLALFSGSAMSADGGGTALDKVDAPSMGTMDIFSKRGSNVSPIVAYLLSQGVKLVSLGEAGGVNTYLGEAANGKYQMFYVSPDGEHVLLGVLFKSGGENVTNSLISSMFSRFNSALKEIPGVDSKSYIPMDEVGQVSNVDMSFMDWFKFKGFNVTPFGSKEGGFDAYFVETTPPDPSSRGVMQSFYVLPDSKYAVAGVLVKKGGVNVTGLQLSEMHFRQIEKSAIASGPKSSFVAPGVVPPSVPDVASKDINSVVPSNVAPRPTSDSDVVISKKSESDADRYKSKLDQSVFEEALKSTVWFSVGDSSAPVLYFVVDPQCPYCHATWEKLKPLVFAKKLQVRVIMVAGLKGSYPLAVSILSRDGNGASMAWLTGEGSTDKYPVAAGPLPGSTGWNKVSAYLTKNSNFIDRFGINRTPFLAYTNSKGILYTSLGLPDDLEGYMAALK